MKKNKTLASWLCSTIYYQKQLNLRMPPWISPDRKEKLYNKSEKSNRTGNVYKLLILQNKNENNGKR